jgi:hypothetical protein
MEPRRGHPVVTQPVKNAPRPLARRRGNWALPEGCDMRLNLRVVRNSQSDWTGNYESVEAALADLQEATDRP